MLDQKVTRDTTGTVGESQIEPVGWIRVLYDY